MSLTHFRNKQKIIAWIIAIPLIATFTLFGLSPKTGRGAADLISVDGEVVSEPEFSSFRSRLRAINPGMRFYPDQERQLMQIGFMMYQLKQAKEIGIKVSDEEIGSYTLKNPFFQDPKTKKFDQKLFKRRIADYFKMNVAQYRRAVEEHLLLDKFQKAIDSTSTVSPLEVYNIWAMEQAAVTYDVISVKTSDYKEKAAESFEDIEKEMASYVEENSNEYEMRRPGLFQLEYIISKYDAMPVIKPDAGEVKKYFMEHKDVYKDKTFATVKKEIEEKLIRENQKAAAARKIRTEVDSLISQISADYEIVSAEVLMERLKKTGVAGLESGLSSKDTLTLENLEKHPVLGACPELMDLLKNIDMKEKAKRDPDIAELKTNFNKRKNEKNLSNEVGVFKIRIVEYKPGEPLDIKSDAAFRKMIKDRVINKKAVALAEAAIEDMRIAILDGKTEGLKFETKKEKLSKVRGLGGADIRIDEPGLPEKTTDGFSVKILRSRSIPSYAEFSQLPTEKREQYKRRAIRFSRGFSYGRYGYLPGNRYRLWNLENEKKNPVKILVKFEKKKK